MATAASLGYCDNDELIMMEQSLIWCEMEQKRPRRGTLGLRFLLDHTHNLEEMVCWWVAKLPGSIHESIIHNRMQVWFFLCHKITGRSLLRIWLSFLSNKNYECMLSFREMSVWQFRLYYIIHSTDQATSTVYTYSLFVRIVKQALGSPKWCTLSNKLH